MRNCWFAYPQSSCNTFFFINWSYLRMRRNPFFLYRNRSKLNWTSFENFDISSWWKGTPNADNYRVDQISAWKNDWKDTNSLFFAGYDQLIFIWRKVDLKNLAIWWVGWNIKILKRTDKESSIIVLKIDRNDKRIIRLNADKSFMISNKNSIDMFDFNMCKKRTISISYDCSCSMTYFFTTIDNISFFSYSYKWTFRWDWP